MTATQQNIRGGTEERIVDAAERLFAAHGIQGVSMRQIAQEAGCSNNVAVQYHFGDRDGLVEAIFRRRLPSTEHRTATLLSAATERGRLGDPRTLVEILLRPLAEERDISGARRYSAFLIGLYHFEGSFALRRKASHLAPMATHAGMLLRRALPHLPEVMFTRRIASASDTFNRSIVANDRAFLDGEGHIMLSDDHGIDDALDIATAIMTTPVAPEILAALHGTDYTESSKTRSASGQPLP